MPILATVVSSPSAGGPRPTPVPIDDRRLDFRALDGSDAVEWTGREWILMSGITGLDVPPRDVVVERVPGLPGARLREIKTSERSVVLPFFVAGDDGAAHRAQLARLRALFDYRRVDYADAEGTLDLVAQSDGGERTLRCVYIDGMEGSAGYGHGGGLDWTMSDIKLLAVDPYWHGQQWSTPTVGTGAGNAFVSNSAPFPRSISGSVALGASMQVQVGGDVESPPSIELTAPWDSVHITSPQGLDVTVGAVASGTVLIETGRRRRVTKNGVAAWGLIGDSPRWQPLPYGEATISIVVTGATSATAARVFGDSLWETAW